MSKQKSKGTRLETALVRYARGRTGDESIDRVALHGNSDMGDVGGLRARGRSGIAECKNYRITTKKGTVAPSLLRRWQDETERERENSGSDFALLVIHRPGCSDRDHEAESFGRNWCWLTGASYEAITGEPHEEGWFQSTVSEVFDLMG